MFHPVSLFIGLRHLRGRSGERFSRFITYISTAGIVIGVMSLITVLSVMNGFERQLKDRILGVLPQAVIAQKSDDEQLIEKTIWSAQPPPFISELLQHTRIKMDYSIAPIVRSEAVIQSPSQLSVGLIVGILPLESDPLNNHLIAGDLSTLQEGKYQLFLGHTLARNLNVNLGDKVRLMVTNASQYTPLGRIPSQRNFTVSGLFNTGSDVDGQLIITHISDAARLMRWNNQAQKRSISGWRLFFEDPFVVADLAKLPMPEGWYWSDWRSQRGELFQAVKMEKNMMGLMLGLIIAVAAFNIVSALIMVVMEKQAEIAILKTMGTTNKQILTIFMVQGASSGVLGAFIGGVLGIVLSLNINTILKFIGVQLFNIGGTLPILVNYSQIGIVLLMAILLSLIATLFPAISAASMKPAEALRYE